MAKTEKTLADLCVEYNALLVAAGKKPVKKLTCSRAEALAKIAKLSPKKAAKAKKADGEARVTIKSVAVPLIKAGGETAAVVAAVKKQFPESAFDERHVSWYRSRINNGAIS